jgi:hypothetical protein
MPSSLYPIWSFYKHMCRLCSLGIFQAHLGFPLRFPFVWCLLVDHGSELTMLGLAILGRVPNGTAKLDGFEKVIVVEMLKAGNDVWAFTHHPQGVRTVAGAEGSPGVKEGTQTNSYSKMEEA